MGRIDTLGILQSPPSKSNGLPLRARSHGTGSLWSPYQFETSQEEHDSQICDNITELN